MIKLPKLSEITKQLGFSKLTRNTQMSYWIIAVVLAAFIAFYLDHSATKPATEIGRESPDSAATFIPAGFVLVPIEVANYESLDSILGKFGVVDLYRSALGPHEKPIKVGEHVKILRAPLNPSHFAVLVPENESQRLVAFVGPFTVVVQNPDRVGTRFVKETGELGVNGRHRSRITVEVSSAGG